MRVDQVSLFIVLVQTCNERPEFDSGISVFDVFPQDVVDIFFKKMESAQDREKPSNFLLKKFPTLLRVSY